MPWWHFFSRLKKEVWQSLPVSTANLVSLMLSRDELKKRLKQLQAPADKPAQPEPGSEEAPLQKSLF